MGLRHPVSNHRVVRAGNRAEYSANLIIMPPSTVRFTDKKGYDRERKRDDRTGSKGLEKRRTQINVLVSFFEKSMARA
jgi:hypothetical protein